MNTKPTESKDFGPGYGDFIMQSSDRVLFYFPRAILAHVSPFFKDMFTIGNHATNNDQPLMMEEDSDTLHLLLNHIDPTKRNPAIDARYISGLVKAAHKYQIVSIIEWFQREVFMRPQEAIKEYPTANNFRWPNAGLALSERTPLLVLALAEYLELEDVIRRMLRILISRSIKDLHVKGVALSSALMAHVVMLRQQRIDWYLEQLGGCKAKFQADGRSRCLGCRADFYEWYSSCAEEVIQVPSWNNVRHRITMKNGQCPLCKDGIDTSHSRFSGIINSEAWNQNALAKEKELPELPK